MVNFDLMGLHAKYRATTESELARPSAEDGSSESRAKGTTSAAATAVVKSVGEARPHGIAKSATQNVDEP